MNGQRGSSGGGGDDRELVRAVTRAVVDRVGNAGPAVVEAVVSEVLAAMTGGGGGGAVASAQPTAPYTTARGAQLMPVVGGTPSVEFCLACVDQEKSRKRSRAVLTVTGRNAKGIVARVTARIADLGGDILDISQTLVSDYFTMIIVLDATSLDVPFERFQEGVVAAVRQMGCHGTVMHDDVLTSLHRV